MKKWTIIALVAAIAVFLIEAFLIGQWLSAEKGPKAYMLLTDVDAGASIQANQVVQVSMPKGLAVEALKDPSGYQNKKLPRDMARGKILTKSDFVATEQEEENVQSVVVKLVREYAHKGEMQVGETVNVLCYAQGALQMMEDIRIGSVEEPLGAAGDSVYYVTLIGAAESLEVIARAQLEGNVQIVRNLSGK